MSTLTHGSQRKRIDVVVERRFDLAQEDMIGFERDPVPQAGAADILKKLFGLEPAWCGGRNSLCYVVL